MHRSEQFHAASASQCVIAGEHRTMGLAGLSNYLLPGSNSTAALMKCCGTV